MNDKNQKRMQDYYIYKKEYAASFYMSGVIYNIKII
mgnify:CR=1 FL=1